MDPLDVVKDPDAAPEARLAALKRLATSETLSPRGEEVNNHIHTIYSFSPYTPSMAAWKARSAGLAAAGSVDHDSVSAAKEMLSACAILGLGGCVGFELRVSFASTPFAQMKLNNPDVAGINYMTVQGIRKSALAEANEFLKPLRDARNARNREMVASASALLSSAGFGELDFFADVVPLSKASEGGSITERHILAAIAQRLAARTGRGRALIDSLENNFKIPVHSKLSGYFSDAENTHFLYDVVGLLKMDFLPRFYIAPRAVECLAVDRVVAFARSIGAIPAYPYLGDVGQSPTGDKKAEKFEDGSLDELMPALKGLGFQAIAYMPPRNTPVQLKRLRWLCARYGFLEISGVDINGSRQSFNCPEISLPEHRHLIDATWALVAHEQLSDVDPRFGLFSADNPLAGSTLVERVLRYSAVSQSYLREKPDIVAAMAALKQE